MGALILVLVVMLATWLVLVGLFALAGRWTLARQIASLLPNLVILFKGLLRDPRVPRSSKLLLIVGIAWILSPIDLIPEFIPFVGPLDDAVIAALVLRRILRVSGRDVLADHWRGDSTTLDWMLRWAGSPRPPH
ncbi:MAG: YkvA family protein [Actinomycetota bacterium]